MKSVEEGGVKEKETERIEKRERRRQEGRKGGKGCRGRVKRKEKRII